MSLLLAVAVASALAAIGTPYRTYEAWWSWNHVRAVLGLMLYFFAAGAGGGVVGWGSGRLSGAVATQPWWLRGLVYGFLGAALLRASVRVKADAVRTKGTVVEQTVSALGLLLSWVTSFLDYGAQRGANQWFSALVEEDLLYQSLTIKADIEGRDLPGGTRKQLTTNFATAAEQLTSDLPATKEQGHARLVGFCSSYVTDEHVPKGLFVDNGRTRMKPKQS
jgi:hypothetical protein